MYSTQGEYSENKKGHSQIIPTHSLFNSFPATELGTSMKNKSINNSWISNCPYHNGPYYPKEYIENEDKQILCNYIKNKKLGFAAYHPVCKLYEQQLK